MLDAVVIGPMQLIAVGFPAGSDFGVLLREVDALQGRGVLRLLDALFVTKNHDGTISRVEIGDDDLGDLLGGLVSLDTAELFGLLDGDPAGTPEAASLAPGAALVFLLVEHHWARPLFGAIAGAGGALLGEGFITPEAELLVGAEVAVMDEAAQVISAAHAAEAEASADALQALVEAGLLEAEAIREAADVLVDAGLMVGAAQRKVADVSAAASVSESELRVLRYLPTTMTFGVIADTLGISRSAAKERAERAYKKLGVHRRADAVVRAREIGLLRKHP